MAIEIGPIAKPTIWLVGARAKLSNIEAFSSRVDHAKHLNPDSTLIIGGFTQFDQKDILTFDRRVRIIITTNVSVRASYASPGELEDSLVFQGRSDPHRDILNLYAETYYTLNGKDPIRTKSSVYVNLDMNDAKITTNPSRDLRGIQNLSSLGFLLSDSPTGHDFITLKAVTYQLGNKSRVAIARFTLATPVGNIGFGD